MPLGPTKSYSSLYNPPIHQCEWPNKARTVSESLMNEENISICWLDYGGGGGVGGENNPFGWGFWIGAG